MPNTHSTLTSLFSDVADEIRAKKGTSADIVADNFPSEIASIPTGSGINPLLYAKGKMPAFNSQTLPNIFEITLGEDITQISSGYNDGFAGCIAQDASAPSILTINALGTITAMARAFDNMQNGFKEIALNFSTAAVTAWAATFTNCYSLTTITSPLDLSGATSIGTNAFSFGIGIQNISFVANTIPLSIKIGGSALTNASIISIANGLDETAAGETLTLSATPKAKCTTIMGTVAMDDSSTYHVFSENASGTVTLESFITQTKGWTLA